MRKTLDLLIDKLVEEGMESELGSHSRFKGVGFYFNSQDLVDDYKKEDYAMLKFAGLEVLLKYLKVEFEIQHFDFFPAIDLEKWLDIITDKLEGRDEKEYGLSDFIVDPQTRTVVVEKEVIVEKEVVNEEMKVKAEILEKLLERNVSFNS